MTSGRRLALGVDIGGTGIKAAIVDVSTGELLSERLKVATPEGGEPTDIITVTAELIAQLTDDSSLPVGVAFPSSIRHGVTQLAANVSSAWIGLDAEAAFASGLGRDIRFVNDADAAAVAETHFGAAQGQRGLVIMTTLGTGIGTALLYDGVLIPNAELGHIEIDGHDAESKAANSARLRRGWSWKKWSKKLTKYYSTLEMLFTPELFIVGGGVSKFADEFLPLIQVRTPLVKATLMNNAGILGAAVLAAEANGPTDTPGSVDD